VIADEQTEKQTGNYISDVRPAQATVILPGNGVCGTAHYSELVDGLWTCRRCGRQVEITTKYNDHRDRTGQRKHDWPIDLQEKSGALSWSAPTVGFRSRFKGSR
jgi:hypothetical protein